MHEFCAALGFDERSAVSAAEVLRQGGVVKSLHCGRAGCHAHPGA